MMTALIPFIFFFAMAAIFRIAISSVGARRYREFQDVIDEERAANFARKKDIPEEVFCNPNLDNLPIKQYPIEDERFELIRHYQNEVLNNGKRKIIRLIPPLSNTDIKKRFGYANLDFIIEYEENYFRYVNCLNMYAKSLIKLKEYEDAKIVLDHSIIDMESNIFMTYNLMCEVCELTSDKEKLKQLLKIIDNIITLKYDENLKSKIKVLFKETINNI